jgi:hypothetical protein
VDVHDRLIAGFMFELSSSFECFRDRLQSLQFGNQTVQTLSPEDLLIYLCVHGTKELWARLGWICDVAEVIQAHPDLNWTTIWHEAQRLQVQKMVLLGLLLVERVLGMETAALISVEITTEVQQLVNQVCDRIYYQPERSLKGLTWEKFSFHWLAMSRKRDRLRYGLRGLAAIAIKPFFNLFRPSYKDQDFFPLPQRISYGYYIVRPIRLLMSFVLP